MPQQADESIPVVGGVYATQDEDGSWWVIKVLAVDDHFVHVRTYANKFQRQPDVADLPTLTVGVLDNYAAIGFEHFPRPKEEFLRGRRIQITVEPVPDDELKGYRRYLEAMRRCALVLTGRDAFLANLNQATGVVLPFTRQFVTNILPDEVRYLVVLNGSYDGNPLVVDEQVFPEDTADDGQIALRTAAETAELLWRGGKVPEWVNMTVFDAGERFTTVELLCCGRFTATAGLLYHGGDGYPPFHVLSPPLPPSWDRGKTNERFNLRWRQQRGK